jgi:hypothetical protein
MNYYNTLHIAYHHRLEENNANSLGSTLQACLEFEEQLERTSLHVEDFVKQKQYVNCVKIDIDHEK